MSDTPRTDALLASLQAAVESTVDTRRLLELATEHSMAWTNLARDLERETRQEYVSREAIIEECIKEIEACGVYTTTHPFFARILRGMASRTCESSGS